MVELKFRYFHKSTCDNNRIVTHVLVNAKGNIIILQCFEILFRWK